jgi:hypothetical protein
MAAAKRQQKGLRAGSGATSLAEWSGYVELAGQAQVRLGTPAVLAGRCCTLGCVMRLYA